MNWHERFRQQAGWTRELRNYAFTRVGLAQARNVLEVGCGTGAVLHEMKTSAALHGLDIDRSRLLEARVHAPFTRLVCGDALALPYPCGSFNITFCHFLLLWVADPARALLEMHRVTRSGGTVLALAEPDYTARTDAPAGLQPLGRWQAEGLHRQGADPSLGNRLVSLFSEAGIQILESGQMQPSTATQPSAADRELEWAVLEADLDGLVSSDDLARYKKLDTAAWQAGARRLHVPTYFALGVV